jgi:ribonuclease-3
VTDKDVLIKLALTHSSYSKDHPSAVNNERLEFFGDAVLKLIFSQYLFKRFPDLNEGLLTKYRANLISDDLLARVAHQLGIEKQIIVGTSLQNTRLPKSVLGNAVEAMIAAIYISEGFTAAEDFVLKAWAPFIEESIQDSVEKDYKSILQEKMQTVYNEAPVYETLGFSGPDHSREFELGVYIGGQLLGSGKGLSKKAAGQAAARDALELLRKQGKEP